MEVRVWIPTSGQALPRRLKIVYHQAPGEPISQMTFTNWNLDVEAAEGMFTFEPPQDYSRVAVEEFVAGLVPVSAVAPAATQASTSRGQRAIEDEAEVRPAPRPCFWQLERRGKMAAVNLRVATALLVLWASEGR